MMKRLFELNLRKGRDSTISHNPFMQSLLVSQILNTLVEEVGLVSFSCPPFFYTISTALFYKICFSEVHAIGISTLSHNLLLSTTASAF